MSKNQRFFGSVDGKNLLILPISLSFSINSFSDKAIGKAQLCVAQTSFVEIRLSVQKYGIWRLLKENL
ncbi:hypothetical protein QUB25_04485 [Microcoleus sp. B3-D7]